MTYRVELIPKTSTLDDIIEPWVCSGRIDNRADGAFIFDNADDCVVQGGIIWISYDDNRDYYYNLADFYRVKVVWL